MSVSDTHRAINAVWRIEPARLIAGLTRIVRGDLLDKLGCFDEARVEFERAAACAPSART